MSKLRELSIHSGDYGPDQRDRLLTIQELSELTGLQVSSLYHFVSQGRIPVVRLSRRCIRI
jgi:excisionase family DNA binding protein